MARAVVLLLALGGLVVAAPRHKADDKPVLYYPTTVGDRWVYTAGTAKAITPVWSKEVTAVERKGGTVLVTEAFVNPDGTYSSTAIMEVSEKGVYMLAQDDKRLDRPRCLLKLPAKPGTKWDDPVVDRDGKEQFKIAYTVAGEEQVETAAGKFRAIRVDSVLFGRVRCSEWYAPGIGMVKQNTDSKTTLLLKSFTPGKK